VEYFKILLPSSMWYEGEWFYAMNVASSAPPFTRREPVSMEKWHYGTEAWFKSKVEHLVKVVDTLKQEGLTSA
jgi:hypothetical protein